MVALVILEALVRGFPRDVEPVNHTSTGTHVLLIKDQNIQQLLASLSPVYYPLFCSEGSHSLAHHA